MALPLAGLVAFSHLQFSQIRGRQPHLIVRNILYVIRAVAASRVLGPSPVLRRRHQEWIGRFVDHRHLTLR